VIARKLPDNLQTAYDWTDAAGELDHLRSLTGGALATYCRESAANHAATVQEGGAWQNTSVSESDLRELAEWLRDRPKSY
jgi:hypothetical protein